MPYVFISYSRDDYDAAKSLKAMLWENGIESKMDEEVTASGIPWVEKLQVAINGCYAVLVICTKHSMASQEVCFEWSYAMGKGLLVLPLKYEPDCPMHSRLSQIQGFDFCNPRNRTPSISKLCQELALVSSHEPSIPIPQKAGIEKIFFSRNEMLEEYSIEHILDAAKRGSEILVIARTGEAWAREFKDLQNKLNNKPIQLKIAIVDPKIGKEQWMIVADHGQHDIEVSHRKMLELIKADIQSGRIELYHLPSSPLHSFVSFTNKEDQHIGIFETGAGLAMEERTILILRSFPDRKSLLLDRLYRVFSNVFDQNRLFRMS